MAIRAVERNWKEEREFYERLYHQESVAWIKYLITLSILQSSALIAIGEKLFSNRTGYNLFLLGSVTAFLVVIVSGIFAYMGILCFYSRMRDYCCYRSVLPEQDRDARKNGQDTIRRIAPPRYTEFSRQVQIHAFLVAMILCFSYLLLCFLL